MVSTVFLKGVFLSPECRREQFLGLMLDRNRIGSPSATVIRRSIFTEIGMFDESFHTYGEYDLWLRIAQAYPVDYLDLPLVRYRLGEAPAVQLNIPFSSAIMQAVSDHNMAISLARRGGVSFIYQSQSIDSQAEMVRRVKNFKAGFVVSDSNLRPDSTLSDVRSMLERTGHSTMAVTDDGSAGGRAATARRRDASQAKKAAS